MIFNIPEISWVRIHDSTSDIVEAGHFIPPQDKFLVAVKMGIYKHQCTGRFRLRFHTSKNYNKVFAQSEWSDVADIPHARLFGSMLFRFATEKLLSSHMIYYVTIEADTYTRTGLTSYMSWLPDYPFPANDSAGNYPIEFPLAMRVFAR